MKVKICGITNLQDAEHAVGCGADLIGFVFYDQSPRRVSRKTAKSIIETLPTNVITVGVFVNESNAVMRETADYCGLRILQLHGSESIEQARQLSADTVLKAVPVALPDDLDTVRQFSDFLVLIDTRCDEHGGSGQTGNWELAKQAAASQRIMLAGGLTPDNVVTGIETVNPYGVDVSSGVERAKGQKDPAKVKAFIDAVRRHESKQSS